MPARALLLALVATLAALVAGCGGSDPGPYGNVEGETEATYLELGGLKYQVQISRQLNPNDVEDEAYLEDLPRQSARLQPDEVWFGVFLQVENDSEQPQPASDEFAIEDTQDNVYRPIPLGNANNYRYLPIRISPGAGLPQPNSPAFETPIQGALLVFKINRASLENRPLEFSIESPVGPNRAQVALDV